MIETENKAMSSKKYLVIFYLLLLSASNLMAQMIELTPVRTYSEAFNFPTDICGNKQGDVFVLDGMNDRVVILKKNGGVSEIRPQRDSFYKAVGICMIEDRIWIADTPRSRLLRLESDGRISEVISLDHGTEPVDLVAVDKNKVITDRAHHTVTVLDENNKEKYYWGKRGGAMGEFINPGFIAADPEKRLIIGDILNRRVVSYSQSGRYPQIVAKPGIEKGQIFRPKGIALDKTDRIWIADGYTGAIQLFSIAGKYLGIAASGPEQVLALSSPMGMWFDGDGQLWVVESFANKISVWKIK